MYDGILKSMVDVAKELDQVPVGIAMSDELYTWFKNHPALTRAVKVQDQYKKKYPFISFSRMTIEINSNLADDEYQLLNKRGEVVKTGKVRTMKVSRVKCVVTTEYFKRGKTAVKQRVIRLLKTGSDEGSYYFVQEDMDNCMESFICGIDNLDDMPDGRYNLEIRFYPGTYEYPDECDVEYSLRKQEDA